jgi:hypothetical protein
MTVVRFDALVSAREGRRQDEELLEDEAETASSSWLSGNEVNPTRCCGISKYSFYVNSHADNYSESKRGRLVHHHGCHYAEG